MIRGGKKKEIFSKCCSSEAKPTQNIFEKLEKTVSFDSICATFSSFFSSVFPDWLLKAMGGDGGTVANIDLAFFQFSENGPTLFQIYMHPLGEKNRN